MNVVVTNQGSEVYIRITGTDGRSNGVRLATNAKLTISDNDWAAIPASAKGAGKLVSSILGTPSQHWGAATPTGGASGDIAVGAGKIWVNDGGTWKSAGVV